MPDIPWFAVHGSGAGGGFMIIDGDMGIDAQRYNKTNVPA